MTLFQCHQKTGGIATKANNRKLVKGPLTALLATAVLCTSIYGCNRLSTANAPDKKPPITRTLDSVSAVSYNRYVILPSQRLTIPDKQCKTIVSASSTTKGNPFLFVRTVKATITPNGVELEETASNSPREDYCLYPVGRTQGRVGQSGPRGTVISEINKGSVELKVIDPSGFDSRTALVELRRTPIKEDGQTIPIVDSGY